MYWHKKIVAIMLWVMVGTISSYGATLTVVSKIKNSGIQTPNTKTDKVNGRVICADGNDNANSHPGCDMSTDVGYDATSNTYSGDLIVRTGDAFTLAAGWNITGGNDDVTITSTLPSDKGLSWSKPLNGLCGTGSSISDDGLTLTCVRSGYTTNTTSYSEDTEFGVDVSESALNDTHTGNFTFKVSASGANDASDDSSAELIITASPRWNLQLDEQFVQEYNNSGTMGYKITYPFSIEMDEVGNDTDNTAPAYLGSENLGMDVTIPFTVDLTASANTTLVDCLDDTTSYEKYPLAYFDDSHPNDPIYANHSVATLKSKLDLQCNQPSAGDNISVNYSSLDLTMKHIPTLDRNNRVLPVTRKFGAVGTIEIFVPYSDINATEKKTDADGDEYYELNVTTTLNGFDPDSASNISNFGGDTENLIDNTKITPLKYYPNGKAGGSYSKVYAAEDGLSLLDGTYASGDGRGVVTPGTGFTSVLKVQNTGTRDFNTSIICDVIDSDTFDISKYPDGSEPTRIYKSHTQADVTVEYAVGYVTNTWPNPDPDVDHGDDIIKECSDASVTWYSTYDEAKDAGTVTKVRVKIDKLPYSASSTPAIFAYVHNKARGTRLSDGTYLQPKTFLLNYMAGYDDVLFKTKPGNWYTAYKKLSLLPAINRFPDASDRAILVRAKARIDATLDTTNVQVGDTVHVSVKPTLTSDSDTTESDDNVTVTTTLYPGLTYVPGSSNLGEPTITNNGSTLVWDLGERVANKPIPDINYSVHIEANANKGNLNYILNKISAPTADPVDTALHNITKNVNVNIPVRLMITKSVLTPFVNTDTPIEFESYVRNGTSDPIDNLDIIDTLPFIGDGSDGFDITMGDKTIHHTRTPATNYSGTLAFSSAEGKDECANSIDWYYSNTDPRDINLSPKDDSNKLDNSGSTNWCAGDETGPGASCGFTKADVTAVRMVKTDSVASDKVCTLKVTLDLNGNKIGDIYTNTTGASSDSVTLPVISNDVYATVPTTSIGDFVWLDDNKNGIQDDGEKGVSGIKVILYQGDGNDNYAELNSTITDSNGFYKFTELDEGDYKVGVDLTGTSYKLTDANIGDDDSKDSDVDTTSNQTNPISLPVNKSDNDEDIGLTQEANITINGTIYDDGNGDGNVNGTAISAPDSTQLYVTLVYDSNNSVAASKAVNTDGTYEFTKDDGIAKDTTYKVVLSTELNATTASLPTNWNSADGEKSENDKTNGLDGTADGIVTVAVATANVLNNDFGINNKPTATDKTEPSQTNPGGTTQVTVPTLEGNDTESGNNLTYKITELPTNAKLYCDGTEVTAIGTTCAPDKLKVDPDNGDVTVTFKYTTTDEANVESEPATVTMPFGGLSINGTIYDDGNGNGNVDGTAISAPDSTQLYVTLLDDADAVVASKAVANDGTYSFDGSDGIATNKTYKVVLSTELNATTASLPTNWNNADGEKSENDKTNGLDGTADGIVTVAVATANVLNNDFGINNKPTATDKNVTSQVNPGGNTKVNIPALEVSDKEDGTPTEITIKILPTNGKLYCDGTEVTATGATCAPDKLSVDPDDGELTVSFTYTTTDKAGVESEPADVNVPFTGVSISGNVYDDGDGDANVNGTAISAPDGIQLYATLLDNANAPIATKAIANDGTYSFDSSNGVNANSDYTVILSKDKNATTSSLPANWNSTGENINSAGAGKDATVDGKIAVSLGTSNIPQIDFGINKKPTATDKNETAQVNPGGDTKVVVPTLEVSDKEDGTPTTITIKTLPTNGTLYYNDTAATAGQVITSYDASKLKVDPDNGALTVTFTYTTTDKAGVESDEAKVNMPFTDLMINGTIYDDGNGNSNVDGDAISKADTTQLYVTLLDGTTVVASKAVDSNGKYAFTGDDGLSTNKTYKVVLSTELNSTIASLPTNWNNADGEKSENDKTNGLDTTADGVVEVAVATTNVLNNDFGINRAPTATDKNETSQFNPGGAKQVTVPTLEGSDKESTTLVYKITELPTNAKLYCDGAEVTAIGTACAPDKLKVDPDNGTLTVSFKYTTTDKAGVESEPANVVMPFTGLSINGTVYDDGNGDGNVNGSAISAPDTTQLYVTLLDGSTVLASKALDVNGKYEFTEDDGIAPNKTFTVLLATEANATDASLPANWNSADGEKSQNSKTNGTDGIADAKVAVVVKNDNVENNDFAINKKPTAIDKNESSQLNPGSNTKVAVPTLSGDDKESGANLVYTITELPDNAKLYCESALVTVGTTCTPDKLKVDPDNGDLTVTFKYTTTDQASVVSQPATVNMPFVGLNISGNVYDDGDGDANVNGTPINKPGTEQLYATLLDSTNEPIATKAVANDGTYSFDNTDGINPNSNYTVVLSKDANATSSALPSGWNNTGENINSVGAGKDTTVDGKIAVKVKTSDISKIDFGINHKPTAVDKNETAQLNPGSDTKVAVPTLSGSDDESGSNLIYTIATLPTNAKVYCDGAEATVGTTCAADKLSVDPDTGDQIVEFKYTTTDEAGVVSDTANIVMPFKDIKISGDIFDDGNANNNAKVDGEPISKPDGVQLYVALVDENSNVVASKMVGSDGKYSFNGADGLKASTDYILVLSTQADSKDASLPKNWNNTGENINSLGDGDDGKSNGIIAVSTKGLSITKPELTLIDFGINKKPEAKDVIVKEPIINSSDVQYHQVPTLIVSDKEYDTPTTITIKTLPDVSTGVLYYNDKPVTAGEVITDYDPTKLTVDPVDGNPIVEFDYTTTDAADVESDVAHVKIPFKGYMYVGDRVWLDDNGNGLQDEGEEGVEGIVVKLYAKDGTLLKVTETNSTGEYQFEIKTPGEFYLEFDKTKTYTAPNRGDNTLDSDVIAHSNKTELFAMDWGQRDMNIDAGIVSSIGNYVWYDENLNGIQDKGEPGVTEVKVTLLSKSRKPVKDVYGNIVKPTKTDKNGYYQFNSIVPNGEYIIKVDIPTSYLPTLQNRGSDELDSDADKNGEIHIKNVQFNDYSLDTGIYCECDDYKVNTNDYKDLKASALNVLGLIAMLMAVFILARRED